MSLILSLHVVFLILWSAALLYFPQLLARHAAAGDAEAQRQAVHMQRTLYAFVMTPSALLTVLAGSWLIFERGFAGGWLQVKLALVFLMVLFHVYCGARMAGFRHQRAPDRRWFYRVMPLAPALLITGVVTLVVAKPF